MEIEWGYEIREQVETLCEQISETGETIDFFGKQCSKRQLKILSLIDIPTKLKYWKGDNKANARDAEKARRK